MTKGCISVPREQCASVPKQECRPVQRQVARQQCSAAAAAPACRSDTQLVLLNPIAFIGGLSNVKLEEIFLGS